MAVFPKNPAYRYFLLSMAFLVGLFIVLIIIDNLRTGQNKINNTSRPNFVFILADDLDKDSISYMPKLQSLVASQGASFSNYTFNIALDSPSRATLFRGQYGHTTQILSNGAETGGFGMFHRLGEDRSTLATWLHDSGYQTTLIGKFMDEYPGKTVPTTFIPPGWDEWYAKITEGTAGFNYKLNENGHLKSYGNKENAYETDVLANKSVAFIQKKAKEKSPFFLFIAPSSPGQPAPALRHQNLFTNLKAPRTEAFNENNVSDKPEWIRSLPKLSDLAIKNIDSLYVKRLQSLQAIDELVEKIIVNLEKNGQLKNTYIIFTSDNGYHMGQHRLAPGENTAYAEDISGPLLIRGPGIKSGKIITSIVGNTDIAPTIADLAQAKFPSFVEGQSFVNLIIKRPLAAVATEFNLSGEKPKERDSYLLEQGKCIDQSDNPNSPCPPAFVGVRTKEDVYIEYSSGDKELYNLTENPNQLENSYNTTDPELITTLSQQLNSIDTCSGSSCLLTDQGELITSSPETPTNTPTPTPTTTPGPAAAPTPNTPKNLAVNSLGYIGCSNTHDIIDGYHLAPGSKHLFWPFSNGSPYFLGDYPIEGNSVDHWAYPAQYIDSHGHDIWYYFSAMKDRYNGVGNDPQIIWIQMCENILVGNGNYTPATYEGVVAMFNQLKTHLAYAGTKTTFYISPLHSYDPANLCFVLGSQGEAIPHLAALSDQAVANGLALRGPGVRSDGLFALGPTTTSLLYSDLCHPNGPPHTEQGAGSVFLGTQLMQFFDNPSNLVVK